MQKSRLVSTINLTLLAAMLAFGSLTTQAMTPQAFKAVKTGFLTPAENNRPWCYWYWINDDISKDGITKDLTAMKEAGIGAALIGNINPDEKDGKVPLFSDLWWECMVHAVTEGKRIGVDIGVFNCPGWSQSGGPWVTSEMAMRYMTYSQTTVEGPGKVNTQLLKPKTEFEDLYVLAFPTIHADKVTLNDSNCTITAQPAVADWDNWFDGDTSTHAALTSQKGGNCTIDFKAEKPIRARSLILHPGQQTFIAQCKVQAKINGQYETIKEFTFNRSNNKVGVGFISDGPVVISLPETFSSLFKLVCTHINKPKVGFSEIILSEKPVLEKHIEKQLGKMHPTPLPMWGAYIWDGQESYTGKDISIPETDIIDISDKMDVSGQLEWQVPAGQWTVVRFGMTPTGTQNSPAAPQGKGYEIDKANAKLIRYHFDQFVGELLQRIPEQDRDGLKYVIADSYEKGSQNWTDGFEKRFEKKYGYNPKKWLPVLSGMIVGSVEESDRFLWDLRRAVADDVAHEYVGGLKKVSNEHNLKTWLENYGHWGFPGEFLMYGGQSDLVSGEFWNEGTLGNIECKAASSCAHTYGKPITSAEAFTCAHQSYMRHPAMLKKRGDWSFTEGINHFVFHLYIQQPDDSRVPGMNAWFATEFNRHNTWFKQSKHWMDYVRRCQHMLQQGNYVADVCYFISENTPKMTGVRNPELPTGYSYDYINAEVIVRDMKVKDGQLVLPDGMAYKLMVLPPLDTMRPAVAAKLEKLVRQGGAIYGPKPVKSPSLQDYPRCDRQLAKTADKLWGRDYDGGELNRKHGKGHTFNGIGLEKALDELQVGQDVSVENAPILWTHRSDEDLDIYFITNQSEKTLEITPAFRVPDLRPQLWDAVTGEIRQLNVFTQKDGQIEVPLTLQPRESQFIVFTEASLDGAKPGYRTNFPAKTPLITLDQPWTVDFANKDIGPKETVTFDRLSDWAVNRNELIKYYSGTATYTSEFTMDEIPADQELFINLGHVDVMAEVTINGQFVGGTWIAPYVLNVTDALKQGTNTIKIDVVNLWRNHLVKDEALPDDQRYTWVVVKDVKKDEPLQPSGLMGPVTIETIVE